jgi:hypothetical protein
LKLSLTTSLNSPVKDVIKTLKGGDRLRLVLKGRTVLAETKDGKTAGSITTARQPELVKCLGAGHEFVAKVTRIAGGACEVEIRPGVI